MTKRRSRRHFTAEYKREAVRLARASGKGVAEVAQELDLTETSLRAWIKQADVDERQASDGPLTSAERAEIARLRRELRKVTQERDVLKKATAFFAKTST
ncbi:MAG: transposase [Polyangiaceae bacterium]|nr:transposase [Polyangiaceae bacterium]MBK8940466.1 transposase [Polyangiaceae bacterium]